MVKLARRVVDAPRVSTPIVDHWNALMEAVFPVELSGVRWTTLDVYPHVDMIQGDLDVQTLCCHLPPDHLHVRSNLANGNTLYYWLEPSSDQHMYRVLKAMHGRHPYWHARVHFFEVSPFVIESSPLLKEKCRGVQRRSFSLLGNVVVTWRGPAPRGGYRNAVTDSGHPVIDP